MSLNLVSTAVLNARGEYAAAVFAPLLNNMVVIGAYGLFAVLHLSQWISISRWPNCGPLEREQQLRLRSVPLSFLGVNEAVFGSGRDGSPVTRW